MPPPVPVSIGAKIAPEQATQIRELIESGLYLDESDFVRDAIRHRLSEIKVIKCRDVEKDIWPAVIVKTAGTRLFRVDLYLKKQKLETNETPL